MLNKCFCAGEFPWEKDLVFFLHVWSAALVIHCSSAPILRRIMAAFIDAIAHFSRTFALSGYSLILPSMLQVKSLLYYFVSTPCIILLFITKLLSVRRKVFFSYL